MHPRPVPESRARVICWMKRSVMDKLRLDNPGRRLLQSSHFSPVGELVRGFQFDPPIVYGGFEGHHVGFQVQHPGV